jgi:hypothetical protein
MCVVSAVTDHYRGQWPLPAFNPFTPGQPFNPPLINPNIFITPEQWAEYQRLKKAAEEIDKLTGQPDCVKPGVAEWEEAVKKIVDERIQKLRPVHHNV